MESWRADPDRFFSLRFQRGRGGGNPEGGGVREPLFKKLRINREGAFYIEADAMAPFEGGADRAHFDRKVASQDFAQLKNDFIFFLTVAGAVLRAFMKKTIFPHRFGINACGITAAEGLHTIFSRTACGLDRKSV